MEQLPSMDSVLPGHGTWASGGNRATDTLLWAERSAIGRWQPGCGDPDVANLTTVNLTMDNSTELTALVRTRRKRVQYRPGLLVSFLASTRLEFEPLL
jgi:hypothetical protein